MAHQRPSRRRDRQPPPPDGDYYNPYDPYDLYDRNRDFYDRDPAPQTQTPPRRHKSERHRRPPSPAPYYYASDSAPASSGGRPTRHDPPRRGRSAGPAEPSNMRHGASPPSFVPEPEPSRRHPRSYRPGKDPRLAEAYATDPYSRDAPSPRTYSPAPRAKSSKAHRRGDPHSDVRGDPRGSARGDPRGDPRLDDAEFRPRPSRSSTRAPPPDQRPRGRAPQYLGSDGEIDDYAAMRRRRPRSQARGHHDQGYSPPRDRPPPTTKSTRGREPPVTRGRDRPATKARDPQPRRSSMPASTKARRAASWWQNPMVQAGARTAFTAGAQAAMKSRDDPSPWLGAKGAKIATAALGAALVDGFMGQKHPGGARHTLMKEGVDVASGKVGSSGRRH
ncbi:Fc.00g035490.m01.CDS01 [Cosmosporella sp. VM-42]